jgi:hypothetical protein
MHFAHAPAIYSSKSFISEIPFGTFAITDVAFGNGMFMAVYNQLVYTSTDGSTWYGPITRPAGGSNGVTAARIRYAPTAGLFVVSAFNNAFVTTADGVTWNTLPQYTAVGGTPVARRFAVSDDAQTIVVPTYFYDSQTTTTTGYMFTTTNSGTAWATRVVAAGDWTAIAQSGGKFFAVSDGGSGATGISSTNITAWTTNGSIPALYGYYDVASNGSGQWVAVYSNYASVSNDNAVTWTRVTNSVGGIDGLAYSSLTGLWYAAGVTTSTTSYVYTSPNGTTWTQRPTIYTKSTALIPPRIAVSDSLGIGVLVFGTTDCYTFTL